jgi:hypothetical protein
MLVSYKSRLVAAGVHFLCSLVIFSLLLFLVIKVWYPQPYFSAAGGWQGLKIVALVDLVLGPLVTLIIFSPKKPAKELLLDMSVIVAIQLSALAYGVYTVYTQRPVAAVFWESKFYTVPASAFAQQGLDIAMLDEFSKQRPALIYVQKPASVAELQAMMQVISEQRIPPTQQVDLYRAIDSYKQAILQHSIDIDEIIRHNADMAEQLQSILSEQQAEKTDYFYVVLESKYQNIIFVLNADAEQVGFLKAPYKAVSSQ